MPYLRHQLAVTVETKCIDSSQRILAEIYFIERLLRAQNITLHVCKPESLGILNIYVDYTIPFFS